MNARTVRLTVGLDPAAIGARSGLLWSHDVVLAGVGEALRLRVPGPDALATVQPALAELAGENEFGDQTTGDQATGPVAFAAFPFDRASDAEVIVPEIVVGHGPQGDRWLTIIDDGSLSVADAIAKVETLMSAPSPVAEEPSKVAIESSIAPQVWCDEVLTPVRDRIRSGELSKTVLARELTVTCDTDIDIERVINRLGEQFATSIVFAVDGFVGASPELLVSRSGDVVRAHPLAGTAPRSSDPGADHRLAAELLASDKNRAEHAITIDWLLDTLLPFCSYVDAEPDPTLVSLANVHHLGTRVNGRLSAPAASVLELVDALHPTPAVGGNPQAAALDLIAAYERLDRRRYAGPVGWFDGAGNGAFAVAIRSAEITGPTARVYAGVGVVAASDPQAELAETRAKFKAMLGVLTEL